MENLGKLNRKEIKCEIQEKKIAGVTWETVGRTKRVREVRNVGVPVPLRNQDGGHPRRQTNDWAELDGQYLWIYHYTLFPMWSVTEDQRRFELTESIGWPRGRLKAHSLSWGRIICLFFFFSFFFYFKSKLQRIAASHLFYFFFPKDVTITCKLTSL